MTGNATPVRRASPTSHRIPPGQSTLLPGDDGDAPTPDAPSNTRQTIPAITATERSLPASDLPRNHNVGLGDYCMKCQGRGIKRGSYQMATRKGYVTVRTIVCLDCGGTGRV